MGGCYWHPVVDVRDAARHLPHTGQRVIQPQRSTVLKLRNLALRQQVILSCEEDPRLCSKPYQAPSHSLWCRKPCPIQPRHPLMRRPPPHPSHTVLFLCAPQGSCTCCPPARNTLPQGIDVAYPSLPAGLCSNVTCSESLPRPPHHPASIPNAGTLLCLSSWPHRH